MENELTKSIYTFDYLDEMLDTELQMQDRLAWQMADSFVRTGYYLRIAQDTDVLNDTEYVSVEDYGQQRFGLDKSRVSRYININKEYSKDGYSTELQDRYQGFGWSKLALMLSLPEAVREEISPAYTKAEIQAIKDEVDEENKISDIEVMLEEPQKAQIELGTTLMKVMYQILHDYKDIFKATFDVVDGMYEGQDITSELHDIFVEDDEACYTARIAGQGKYQFFMRGLKDPATIVSVRTGERENAEWGDITEAVKEIQCSVALPGMEESYKAIYGEPFENAEQTGNEPKNTSKVKTAAKPHNERPETPVESAEKNEETNTNSQDFPMNPPELTENQQIYHDGTIYEEPQPRISTSQDPILDSNGIEVHEEVEYTATKTQQEEIGRQDDEEPKTPGTEEAIEAWKDLRVLTGRIDTELPTFYQYCSIDQMLKLLDYITDAEKIMQNFVDGAYGVELEEE